MSSIAYNTDSSMIEFHRLNGSQTMVFWRFSLRQFARFSSGDLVFFIDKRYKHPITSEKGIIGYGRCTDLRNSSVKGLYDKHQSNTGYRTYKEFTEAIRHFRKNDHRLPSQIQAIKLDNVLFFQTPIFLSEVGMDLSGSLESFTYLEKEGVDLSVEILKIAQTVGVDEWMISQNEEISDKCIENDISHQEVRSKMASLSFTLSKEQLRIIKNHTDSVAVNNIWYKTDDDVYHIYLPMHSKSEFTSLIGMKALIESTLNAVNLKFVLITHQKIEKRLEHQIQLMNLKRVQI